MISGRYDVQRSSGGPDTGSPILPLPFPTSECGADLSVLDACAISLDAIRKGQRVHDRSHPLHCRHAYLQRGKAITPRQDLEAKDGPERGTNDASRNDLLAERFKQGGTGHGSTCQGVRSLRRFSGMVDPQRWPDQVPPPRADVFIAPKWFFIVIAVCVVILTLWVLDH